MGLHGAACERKDTALKSLGETMTDIGNSIRTVGQSALYAALAALALSACGVSEDDTDSPSQNIDPATSSALEDELLVDPDLVESGNLNNVLDPSGPNSGAQPSQTSATSESSKAAASAEMAETGLLNAPEPTIMASEDCVTCDGERTGATLGARADIQSKGKCDANLKYDAKWATRMPSAMKVYPRAVVKEAAGVDGGPCNIRAVTFTTMVGIKDVVNYYYTRARNNKYSTEYQLRDGEHTLGGARESDDAAYIVFLRKLDNGLTEVDIVANQGR